MCSVVLKKRLNRKLLLRLLQRENSYNKNSLGQEDNGVAGFSGDAHDIGIVSVGRTLQSRPVPRLRVYLDGGCSGGVHDLFINFILRRIGKNKALAIRLNFVK